VTPAQFAALRRTLHGRLLALLLGMFDRMPSAHRPDAVRFATAAVPLVEGAQTALAGITSNYVAQTASAALRRPIAPPPIPRQARARLRLKDPAEVYQRPFVAAYTALADRKPLPEALDAARVRLREVAEGDLQQTYAESARAAMQALPPEAQPSGYRRVLNGEENCALCVVASTQLYNIEELSPIHPGCDCTVDPFYGDYQNVLDPELLERVHGAVMELTGKTDRGARVLDYRKIMTQMVHTHGELGPMLARPLDRFTGPRDISSA
jgi:hypothetical protein